MCARERQVCAWCCTAGHTHDGVGEDDSQKHPMEDISEGDEVDGLDTRSNQHPQAVLLDKACDAVEDGKVHARQENQDQWTSAHGTNG